MYRKMFFNKKMKKGYIFIYVLLIAGICSLMVLYIFKMEVENLKTAESVSNTIITNDSFEEDKEFLFTYLSNYIISGLGGKEINEVNIKDIFSLNFNTFKITYKDSYVIYDKVGNTFKINSYIDEYTYQQDIYNFGVKNNKIDYIYVDTICFNGKL